jgi:hypothetical protein
MHRKLAFLCFVASSLLLIGGRAAASTRADEIAECRRGEMATWGDGQDRKAVATTLRFLYRHTGAPFWFSQTLVEQAVNRAADGWSACGIPVQRVAEREKSSLPQKAIVIEWNDAGSRGNFGLADLGLYKLSLGPAAFQLLKQRNPRHDATQTLQMVISHEMGHFFGLMAHSRRCIDVLSYYTDGKGSQCFTRDPSGIAGMAPGVDYRHVLPTACDIQRCRRANGLLP